MSTGELAVLHTPRRELGYGRMGVDLSAALARQGLTVYDSTPGITGHDLRFTNPGLTNTVMWCSLPSHVQGWYEGQHAVIFTMWEATELPEGFRENLDCFDQVLVPSIQNVHLFSQYHPNVKYVPLGIGGEWHFRNLTDPDREFRFLTAGSGARKGVDVAIAAFRKAFPNREQMWPRPVMVHKNPRGEAFVGVETVPGYLPAEDELELYASAHCYVGASRGEGFGLQPLQAIGMGLPTILTNAHGHESFAHLGLGVDADLVKADYFMFGDAGEWWEPRVDDIVDRMRWVYDNWGRAKAAAALNALHAHTEFSWDRSAQATIQAIGADRLTAYDGSGEWKPTRAKRFLIRVVSKWEGNVAGRHIQFLPGKDYWDLADIKRMVSEHGVLDPSCKGDPGVPQDSDLPAGDHHYCPTCQQRMGSAPTKADDLFDQMEREAVARSQADKVAGAL